MALNSSKLSGRGRKSALLIASKKSNTKTSGQVTYNRGMASVGGGFYNSGGSVPVIVECSVVLCPLSRQIVDGTFH